MAPAPSGAVAPLLDVRDLSVDFDAPGGVVHAVREASFTLGQGEILGIVGESGCGKSTLARALLKLIDRPGRIAGGSILYEGRDLLTLPPAELRRVRGREIAMVFQDPAKSLNPVLTIGKQLAAVIEAHQERSKAQIRADSIELLGQLGIPAPERRVDQYPYELSGGMRQRVMIAMALSNRPKVIVADEATTALDVTVQAQILDLLRNVNDELRTSIAFISHNLGVVAELCHRVIVLYGGRVVEAGPIERVFSAPRHPYTRALLASLPTPGASQRRLAPVPGAPPIVTDALRGCSFAPRCPLRIDRCAEDPPLREVGPGQEAACWVAQQEAAPSAVEARR
jgi:oligopeptide/dipeptide ABC transporter ATP-binding protein